MNWAGVSRLHGLLVLLGVGESGGILGCGVTALGSTKHILGVGGRVIGGGGGWGVMGVSWNLTGRQSGLGPAGLAHLLLPL
jgi:hypothetical protein